MRWLISSWWCAVVLAAGVRRLPAAQLSQDEADRRVHMADEDGDGAVSRDELLHHLRAAMTKHRDTLVADEGELKGAVGPASQKLFNALDKDSSGAVTRREAVQSDIGHAIRDWKLLDANGDNMLTRDELSLPSAKQAILDDMKDNTREHKLVRGVGMMMRKGDTNEDGKLSAAELSAVDLSKAAEPVVREALAAEAPTAPKMEQSRAYQSVRAADKDGDGQLDHAELHDHLRADMHARLATLKDGDDSFLRVILEKEFVRLDADGDHVITKVEADKRRPNHFTDENWNVIDLDGDGTVTYAEFDTPAARERLVTGEKNLAYVRGVSVGTASAMEHGDTNGDGKLSAKELGALDLSRTNTLVQELLRPQLHVEL